MSHNTLLFIPCYNCEKQIERLLKRIPEELFHQVDILIVDNLSEDDTLNKILQQMKNHKFREQIKVRRNISNYGLSGSFKNAFLWARQNNYQNLILLHGDDQADPLDALKLLKSCQEKPQLSAIFGSRFSFKSQRHNYSYTRFIANLGFNAITSALTKTWINEIGSGLNLYKIKDFPSEFIESLPKHIAFDLHILLFCIEQKMDFSFEPISWKSQDEKSTINDFSVGLQLLNDLLKWKLGKRSQPSKSKERPWEDISGH